MTWCLVSVCVSFKIVIIVEIVLLVLQADSQQMYFPPTPIPKSRALGTAQVYKLLQCYLQASLLLLDHCTFLALYFCEGIVMEHKHNNITGKAFIELVFTVVCTGCKQCSLLPQPMSMFSLLSLQLIPVLSPPIPPRFSPHFLETGPSILKLPCGAAPGKLGPRLHWHLSLSCSAALCLWVTTLCWLSLLNKIIFLPSRLLGFPRTFCRYKALKTVRGKK